MHPFAVMVVMTMFGVCIGTPQVLDFTSLGTRRTTVHANGTHYKHTVSHTHNKKLGLHTRINAEAHLAPHWQVVQLDKEATMPLNIRCVSGGSLYVSNVPRSVLMSFPSSIVTTSSSPSHHHVVVTASPRYMCGGDVIFRRVDHVVTYENGDMLIVGRYATHAEVLEFFHVDVEFKHVNQNPTLYASTTTTDEDLAKAPKRRRFHTLRSNQHESMKDNDFFRYFSKSLKYFADKVNADSHRWFDGYRQEETRRIFSKHGGNMSSSLIADLPIAELNAMISNHSLSSGAIVEDDALISSSSVSDGLTSFVLNATFPGAQDQVHAQGDVTSFLHMWISMNPNQKKQLNYVRFVGRIESSLSIDVLLRKKTKLKYQSAFMSANNATVCMMIADVIPLCFRSTIGVDMHMMSDAEGSRGYTWSPKVSCEFGLQYVHDKDDDGHWVSLGKGYKALFNTHADGVSGFQLVGASAFSPKKLEMQVPGDDEGSSSNGDGFIHVAVVPYVIPRVYGGLGPVIRSGYGIAVSHSATESPYHIAQPFGVVGIGGSVGILDEATREFVNEKTIKWNGWPDLTLPVVEIGRRSNDSVLYLTSSASPFIIGTVWNGEESFSRKHCDLEGVRASVQLIYQTNDTTNMTKEFFVNVIADETKSPGQHNFDTVYRLHIMDAAAVVPHTWYNITHADDMFPHEQQAPNALQIRFNSPHINSIDLRLGQNNCATLTLHRRMFQTDSNTSVRLVADASRFVELRGAIVALCKQPADSFRVLVTKDETLSNGNGVMFVVRVLGNGDGTGDASNTILAHIKHVLLKNQTLRSQFQIKHVQEVVYSSQPRDAVPRQQPSDEPSEAGPLENVINHDGNRFKAVSGSGEGKSYVNLVIVGGIGMFLVFVVGVTAYVHRKPQISWSR